MRNDVIRLGRRLPGPLALLPLLLAFACGGCGTESSVNNDPAPWENGRVESSFTGSGGVGASPLGSGGAQPGTGGMVASTGGVGPDGTGGVTDVEPPVDCEIGPTPGSSVLLIGDSYVDINAKAFGTELVRLARANGSLGGSDQYIDRSVSGTQLAGVSLLGLIPAQYTAENNGDGHIRTVIMDGGGNDVLVGNRSCIDTEAPPSNQGCVNTLDDAMEAAQTMLAEMASDGVQDVIYFFYPHLPGGGLGGNKELTNATIDYAIERTDGLSVVSVCADAPLNCVFVDTRGLFPAEAAEFQDGIHPTVANTQKISARVWEAMKGDCIAQ